MEVTDETNNRVPADETITETAKTTVETPGTGHNGSASEHAVAPHTATSYEEYLTMDALGRNSGAPNPQRERTITITNTAAQYNDSDSGNEGGKESTDTVASPQDCTFGQTMTRISHGIQRAWRKRPKFPFTLYVVVFVLVTMASVLMLQWSMYTDSSSPNDDDTTRMMNTVAGKLTMFVAQMWLDHQYQFLLNCLLIGVVYLAVIFFINRFWIATAVTGTTMAVFAVANRFKVQLRNEPIIPADLNFVTGGNTGEILSFVPSDGMSLIRTAVSLLVVLCAGCVALQFLDRRNGLFRFRLRDLIHFRSMPVIVTVKHLTALITRWVAFALTLVLLLSFAGGLTTPDSWAKNFATRLSDAPQLWNAHGDALNNGPAMNFARLSRTKIMDEPEGYSKEEMQRIAKKYAKAAKTINATRTNTLTDSTVIMILSESFSDPTRVPGISFSEDPMPFIRSVEASTTSGLALSTGYGGGTANLEYQALSGLNMANYDPLLTIAYQQLVPNQKWTPTFNQLWNQAGGEDRSQALHSYNRNMYFRDTNYKKFAFSKFWSSDGDSKGEERLTDLSPIDSAWYASDKSTYDNVLKLIDTDNGNDSTGQFLQVVTMQNHMPYDDWYTDNQFKDADTSEGIGDDERLQIDTYAKGVNYTDQETERFLDQLNQIDRPITVIFYGDHLPGIYATASADPANTTTLHETDYFIWSNSSTTGITDTISTAGGYTSSNYFMAQAAAHMNATVSPYLAFLTQMHEAIPAIATPSAASGDADQPVYLNADGQRVAQKDLSAEAKQLLHDYQLIQYDVSKGKQYLKDTGFMDLQ